MGFEGKIALVTGAGRGIGRAIAERIGRAGADIALADVSGPLLADAQEEIQALGRRTVTVRTDVAQKPEVDAMVARVVDALGPIDLFFNNAGIIEVAPFLECTEAHWDRIMAVNAKGVFLCGQAVARHMVGSGRGGKIINTASLASRVGIPDMAAYAASKAAVMSLTRSMALALAPHGITVNALAPGIVATDMWTFIDEQRATLRGQVKGEPLRERVATIPLGRAAVPEDVAAVAEFLASDASNYLTGQTINIDGGVLPS